jgi:hypothetical protein
MSYAVSLRTADVRDMRSVIVTGGSSGASPTRVSNHEMLYRAYRYYFENRREIQARKNVSAHRRASYLGVINLLKWLS